MTGSGLSAAELRRVVAALQGVTGLQVLDAARIAGRDDLLLVLGNGEGRQRLHLVPGGLRGRVTLTARRFAKGDFATGPQSDALRRRLTGARLAAISQPTGERICTLELEAPEGRCRLHVELFGPRGLWCLTAEDGTVLELSRQVRTKSRTVVSGSHYAPPPPAPILDRERVERFAEPVLEAVDAWFLERDLAEETGAQRRELERVLRRALRRTEQKLAGLQRQLAEADAADRLRADADVLLAYAHQVPPGATEVELPDPLAGGSPRRLALAADLPARKQAEAWYRRARRLQEGRAIAEQRRAGAAQELQALQALAATEDLQALRQGLQELGLWQPAAAPAPSRSRRQAAAEPGIRRFCSVEGYPILVGRSNTDNDRLTRRIARGNDLWLHVGGGRAGSHVIVRLPRGKTASLETLLDAGTLAVHFSKARGERLCEVVYTQAKHVRKPKGSPPGRVLPGHTRTLAVRLDEERLRRLLASQQ